MPDLELDVSRQPVWLVIISGLSGSGKSTAIRALEDSGFFCIDNLPIVLLPKLIDLFPRRGEEIERIALVVDAREERFLHEFDGNIERFRGAGGRVDVVFLDCADDVLIRRYNETRRRHPLAPEGSVEDGIARERTILKPLRDAAGQVFDTTGLTPHELRRIISDRFTRVQAGHEMTLALVSFGFKHGIPAQVHLVFDVRFLANPYFDEKLREENGLNPEVAGFVMRDPDAGTFLEHVSAYLDAFSSRYNNEGKSYLTLGIGCTGGKHRSVVMVEELARRLKQAGVTVAVRHRDLHGD